MRRKTIISAVAVASAAGVASANHVDFIVDGLFNLAGPGSTVVAGDGANILGGLRFVGIDTVNSGDSQADLLDGNDFINFDNVDGAAGVLTLDYGDFVGGNGALNADFATNWNFIAVDIRDASGQGALSIAVESSAGAGVSASQIVDSAGIYYFAFSDAGLSLVDFGDVDRVTVTLAANAGADFDIGAVTREVVPAPASVSMLALGGLCATRRRRA